MSARWEAAFDAQVDLWRFWHTVQGERYAEGFADSIQQNTLTYAGLTESASEYQQWRAEQSVGNFQRMLAMAGGGDPVQGILNIERSKILLADPIFVSDEMMDLTEAAAQSFVPEPLLPTDLICPSGFLLLPRPMRMLDVHRKYASFRAFAWMPAQKGDKHGITMSLYSFKDDMLNPEVDDYAEMYTAKGIGQWGMLHTTAWMFDEPVPQHFTADQGWWRDVQCLLRLSMQYISTVSQQQPGRAQRKRAERLKMGEKYVTVVTLRRPRSQKEGESSPRDWANRWIVGGHWRSQWYPASNTHRQIWISPYIKGPEDKELKLRKMRAFEVVR